MMHVDPVCKARVDEQESIKLEYLGHTYYFCSEDCRDSFQEHSDKYTQQ